MSVFERYLSVWVAACMALGIAIGKMLPAFVEWLRSMELGQGSQINIPIAVLIWLMIYPMMLKIDFASIRSVGRRPTGLFITVFVNWLVKPSVCRVCVSSRGWFESHTTAAAPAA
jgi:arsenite transporter